MRRELVIGAAALVVGVGTTFALERDASACGGCFGPPPPPTESPTVVTDHRMILSVSKEQSTLYDQIRYQGSPASFAWVLPISGTVEVGLSAEVVFQGLDAMTSTVIQAPPQNCPQRPTSCSSGRGAFSPSAGSAGEDANGGVTILKKEIVGPYETVQLQATDPEALHKWLAKNSFVVPPEIKPVIDVYVAEKFNFLALKLVPGKDVKEMRPVRVTTQGANAVLPLRMVAAGTGPTVGIGLWIISEGRYEPSNFKSFVVKTEELVWDWTAQKSNYVDLRNQRTAENGGRAWEVESSLILYRQNIESYVRGNAGGFNGGNGRPGGGAPAQQFPNGQQTEEDIAAQYYLTVKDEQGNVTKTATQVRNEDMDTLFHGIATASTRVTRVRADLSRAALDVDLVVGAAPDQAQVPRLRQVTRELNEPSCPVWDGCTTNENAPRSEAFERSSGEGCSATSKRGAQTWMAVGIGFVGLAVAKVIHRRRRKSSSSDQK